MTSEIAYSVIKKTLADAGYLQALSANPDALLQNEGLTDPGAIAELKQVLNVLVSAKIQASEETASLQQWLAHQRQTTGETADAFKIGLQHTIEQIDNGFRSTAIMYQVGFYLGVALIVFSALFAVLKNQPFLSMAFAGFGIADVIAFFITKPPQQLQRSRADLAQLQAAYFNWFGDIYNWNSVLGLMGQAGNLQDVLRVMKEISATMLENTAKTMEMIEKYCDFVELQTKTGLPKP